MGFARAYLFKLHGVFYPLVVYINGWDNVFNAETSM